MESMISVEEIVWAAGFVDGEGWIGIRPGNKGKNYHLDIAVGQVDIRPLLFLKEKFGGEVYLHRVNAARYPNRQTSYQWQANGWVASDFLTFVLKYLRVKKEKAEQAIAFQNTFKYRGRTTKLTCEQIDFVNRFNTKLAVA